MRPATASLLGLRRIERGRQTVIGNQQCHVCGRAWLNCIHISEDRLRGPRLVGGTRRPRQAMLGDAKPTTSGCGMRRSRREQVRDPRLRRLQHACAAFRGTRPRPLRCGPGWLRVEVGGSNEDGLDLCSWACLAEYATGRPASSGTRARRSEAQRRHRSSSYGDHRTEAPPTGLLTSSPPSSPSLHIISLGWSSRGDGARPASHRPGTVRRCRYWETGGPRVTGDDDVTIRSAAPCEAQVTSLQQAIRSGALSGPCDPVPTIRRMIRRRPGSGHPP